MDPTAPGRAERDRETYDQMNWSRRRPARRSTTRSRRRRSRRAPRSRTTSATRRGSTRTRTTPARSRTRSASCAAGCARRRRTHTNNGKQLLVAAATGDRATKEALDDLNRALAEYKLAALGWQGYLKQDENAPDAYESRYWLADARNKQVRIKVHPPHAEEGPYRRAADDGDRRARRPRRSTCATRTRTTSTSTTPATFVVEESRRRSRPRVPALRRHEGHAGHSEAHRASRWSASGDDAKPQAGRRSRRRCSRR